MAARWLIVVVLLGLFVPAAPGVAAHHLQTGTPAPFTGETFIGVADDGAAAVAVVIAETEGGKREARVYLCDGAERSAWLTGALTGDTLEAASDDASTVIATRDGDTVTGTVTVADGAALAFTTERAAGIAGLYEVVVGNDGTVRGTSADGRRLQGAVAAELADGSLLIAVLIEEPDGGGRAVAVIASADAAGEQRWIVQADGGIVGSAKPRFGTGVVINHEEQYVF